jgi:hypothetical protein
VLPELDQVTLTVTPVHATGRYSLHAESGVVRASAGETGLPGQALVAIEAALASGRRTGAACRVHLRWPPCARPARACFTIIWAPRAAHAPGDADVRKLIDRENIRP